MKSLFLLTFVLLALAQCASAITVVNSLDGRDVVSGIYYAAVRNETAVFVSPGTDPNEIYGKIGIGADVLLIQSSSHPAIAGMADKLTNDGDKVEKLVSDDPLKTNMDLADKSGAKKFVLVDQVYGYNTVSPLAYAKLESMYLIFAGAGNADSVAAFLKGKNAQDVLLYGYTDKAVKDALTADGLKFREINTGDKFDDNMQVLDLYFTQVPGKKQVILSDGNGIEATMAMGDDPVLFIGQVIPASVYSYIKDRVAGGQIQVAMLVDQSFSQTAYDLKTSVNNELGRKALTVLVKIGESVSATGESLSAVHLFPLPGPALGLNVAGAQYNQKTGQLEVTFENTGNALEYVRSSIIVMDDGNSVATVGEETPFPVEAGQKTGRKYNVSITSGEITANVTAYFGASKKSYESGLIVLLPAGRIDFVDSSALSITDFTADKGTNDLYTSFVNNGTVPVYFRAYAIVGQNGTKTTITDDSVRKLEPSAGQMVKFPGISKSGAVITAGADYGARDAFLDKKVEKGYTPAVQAAAPDKGPDLLVPILVAVIILVVGYLAYDKFGKKAAAKP